MKLSEKDRKELDSYIDNRIEKILTEKLENLISDPDAGLDLREEIKELLRKPAGKCLSVEEASKDLGFEW
jgi:vacuolar-type H+-ATPase subunit E/Vma4